MLITTLTESYLVRNGELVNEIKVQEHSDDNFESFAVLVQGVIELVAVQVEVMGYGDCLLGQPVGVIVSCCGMVGEAVQSNSLKK